jgi:hypothetical protein
VRDGQKQDTTSTNGTAKAHPGVSLPVAALFTLLWDALADHNGTAATAVIVRRAARRATGDFPELAELAVVREGLDYRYALPAAWHAPTDGAPEALRRLVAEVLPLLAELTGSVAARHLAQVRELCDAGLIPPPEEQP